MDIGTATSGQINGREYTPSSRSNATPRFSPCQLNRGFTMADTGALMTTRRGRVPPLKIKKAGHGNPCCKASLELK